MVLARGRCSRHLFFSSWKAKVGVIFNSDQYGRNKMSDEDASTRAVFFPIKTTWIHNYTIQLGSRGSKDDSGPAIFLF